MTKATVRDLEIDERPLRLQDEKPRGGWLRRVVSRNAMARENEIELQEEFSPNPEAGGKPPWLLLSFVAMVILPSVLALLYFAFVATDQYTAEARFAVRSLADDGTSGNADSGLVQMQAASQDAFVITSFIHSSEILKRLDGKVDYRAIFGNPAADYFSRFDPADSEEAFLTYWSQHVSAYIDGPSGIVTLTVRSFRPEDSVELVSAILKESETLVNELSVRAREDMLTSFSKEVERAGGLYRNALAALNRFQQQSGLLSPAIQAQETGKLLTGLLAQKLEFESRLFVVQQSAGTESPSYKQMLLVRQSIDQQIEQIRGELTGSNDESLANVITSFSRVETDRMVAERLYEASRRNYDLAFAAALRKGLYLTVFVQPSMPEDSLYPKRIMSPLLIFLGLLVLWSTLCLAWASVEDHRL